MEKEDLQELQKEQKSILNYFHNYCLRNNLKYQIFAGTLLGAIRHNGFIPWDDDIDVCMVREDYENFVKLASHEFSDKYFIQTYESDKEFNQQFTKIRSNNTLAEEFGSKHLNIHKGIWIDVFPLDAYPRNKLSQKMFLFKLRVHSRVRELINNERNNNINYNPNKIKRYIKKAITLIVTPVIRSRSKIWWDNLAYKTRTKYNKSDHDLLGHFTLGIKKENYYKYLNSKNLYLESKLYKFEDIEVYGPKNYDKVLGNLFGDYMKYPAKAERKPHHRITKFKKLTKKERGL